MTEHVQVSEEHNPTIQATGAASAFVDGRIRLNVLQKCSLETLFSTSLVNIQSGKVHWVVAIMRKKCYINAGCLPFTLLLRVPIQQAIPSNDFGDARLTINGT